MLVDLLQQSEVERNVDGVVGLEGKDDGFRGVDEEMSILQPSSCCILIVKSVHHVYHNTIPALFKLSLH